MTRNLAFSGLLALLAVVTFPVSSEAAIQLLGDNAGVNDHPHNLSSGSLATIKSPAGTESRICIFCHTPHSASADGPLWNRRDPLGPTGDGTFPLYGENSGLLGNIEIDNIGAAQYGGANYPNGASRLCLSCHDGVTAIGEVITPGTGFSPLGGLGSIEDENPGSPAVIDLDTSHPISFVYNATVRDAINLAKSDYQLPVAALLDTQERMQCTSCHDPHTDTREAGYDLPMWRNYSGIESTDYEGTCSECHLGGSTSPGLIGGGAIGTNH